MSGFDWADIKAKNPIAEVIGRAINLKQNGKEYKGLCPFHAEKSPSFHVIPDKDFAHCFGCGWHGDVVDFVAQNQGITTTEALARLSGGDARIDPKIQPAREAAMAERAATLARERASATTHAVRRWEAAAPAPEDHGYLTRKKIEPHSARIEGANLLLPIYDAAGDIMSVQSIAPDGGKRFATGAPTKSGRMMIGIHFGRTIIAEGFATAASIYAAMPDQVCVAFSKGNMHVIAREFAADGIPIILAADTNAADEMRNLGAELDCPVAVPTSGGDFNDMATELGSGAVAKAIATAMRDFAETKKEAEKEAAADDAPVDLWAKHDAPALPRGMVPDIIERLARIRGEQMGVDPGGIAMAALTSCAAVIRDEIKLKVKRHENWTESARLWTMLVGPPSFKKSPIMKAVVGRIKKIDGDMLRASNRAMLDWQEAGGNKGGGPAPAQARLRVEDITMESAQEVCRHSPDGILVYQDELSGWFGGMEKYSGGKAGAKDRSFWLTAFGGGEYAVNRIGRGSFLIDNLSVSIIGGVQPEPIRGIVHGSNDDGLIQRFLPVILKPSAIGKDEEVPDIAYQFDDLIDRLHELRAPDSVMGKLSLQFSDDALKIRERLEAKHHALVATTESFNRKLAAHIGKMDGIYPRLCIIWHCIEHVCADDYDASDPLPVMISASTAHRVETFLSDYVMAHSLAFYAGVIGLSDDHDDLEGVAGWILTKKKTKVTIRDIRMGIRSLRNLDRDTGVKLFQRLEAMSWVDQVNTRSDAPAWTVNPAVHEMFADRMDIELANRARVKKAIKSIAGKLEKQAE